MIPRLLCVLFAFVLAATADAQTTPFAPAIRVNSAAITHFEIAQRARFLEVLNTPGDLTREAREQLIDEALQMQQARRFNVVASPDDVRAAMAQFAGRANLDLDAFLAALGERGIAAETFEAFVRARESWRNVVQGLFGARSRPTDEEIQRAMAIAGERGGASVLISEIVLPMTPELAEGNRILIDRLVQTIRSEAEFAEAASFYSVSDTARNGGRLDWVPISNLPPALASRMLTMEPGEMTEPIQLDNAIAIFRLRGLRETGAARPVTQSAEYLRVLFPGGDTSANRERARTLQGRLDRCDDFYGVAKQFPEDLVERKALARAEIPAGLVDFLERLDPHQALIAPVEAPGGPALMFLMLCNRTTAAAAEIEGGADEFRLRLFSARIESYARNHLAELRANAEIEEL